MGILLDFTFKKMVTSPEFYFILLSWLFSIYLRTVYERWDLWFPFVYQRISFLVADVDVVFVSSCVYKTFSFPACHVSRNNVLLTSPWFGQKTTNINNPSSDEEKPQTFASLWISRDLGLPLPLGFFCSLAARFPSVRSVRSLVSSFLYSNCLIFQRGVEKFFWQISN